MVDKAEWPRWKCLLQHTLNETAQQSKACGARASRFAAGFCCAAVNSCPDRRAWYAESARSPQTHALIWTSRP